MKKQFRSRLLASVHETAEGLHEVRVMDKITLRQFDELCLTSIEALLPTGQSFLEDAAKQGAVRERSAKSGKATSVTIPRKCG